MSLALSCDGMFLMVNTCRPLADAVTVIILRDAESGEPSGRGVFCLRPQSKKTHKEEIDPSGSIV